MTTVVNVRGLPMLDLLADPGFVYVGRSVPRAGWGLSEWGNPFRVGKSKPGPGARSLFLVPDAATAVNRHEAWLRYNIRHGNLGPKLLRLDGKALGCWCLDWDGVGDPPGLCHAATLVVLIRELTGTPQHI